MDLTRQKQLSLAGAIVAGFVLLYEIPQPLASLRTTLDPETYLIRLTLLLYLLYIPIVAAWFSRGLAGGLIFALIASAAALFSWTVSHSPYFLWLIPGYGFLCLVLYRTEQRSEEQLSVSRVELEKCTAEKNDLEVEYRHKGESISVFFEKYSTYYNLRKLAEDFSGRISLTELTHLVVGRALEFIPKGDGALLALAYPSEEKLCLTAWKEGGSAPRQSPGAGSSSGRPPLDQPAPAVKRRVGDVFDFWVIRNRKRLLVTDTQKDFRFEPRAVTAEGEEIRSLISAPLLHEGKVLGTLRLQSKRPETFGPDDLRLLDAISTLASAALSNGMLFEKTQELAIRDSLTGLYIQRHFFERLKEEHRRALRSGHVMSLLMCDLDHFKAVNDRWGHGAGDLMLIRFAEILRENVQTGVVARYGGEEFSVLLPEMAKEKAALVAEQIREAMETSPFSIRREKIQMTVSIGVACIPEDTLDDEELVRKADEALYRAKREGRNRVARWAAP